MKFMYAAALALAPFAASAATVTVSGADLIAAETTVNGEFGYAIDLNSLGLATVSSVTVVDSAQRRETGRNTTGFDLDALVVGTSTTDFTAASSYSFTAGGVSAGTQLVGATAGNADVDDAFATLGVFDGSTRPIQGFLSMGNGGSVTANFDPVVAVDGILFIYARDIGTNERLASVTIASAVPLPAGGMLLLSGLGVAAFVRRRRKAA